MHRPVQGLTCTRDTKMGIPKWEYKNGNKNMQRGYKHGNTQDSNVGAMFAWSSSSNPIIIIIVITIITIIIIIIIVIVIIIVIKDLITPNIWFRV